MRASCGPMPQTVVVLNSYHQGFVWTDRIMEGLSSSLDRFGSGLDLRLEYLDAKRRPPTSDYRRTFAETLRLKYDGINVDAVVVTDNAALDFVIEYRSLIFHSSPVVFCGINNFSGAMLKGQSNITGVSEDPDIAGTIGLALKLTGATAIALVTDTTDTGIQNRDVALRVLKDVYSGIEYRELSGDSLDLGELEEALRGLGNEWSVLFLDFFQNRSNEYLAVDAVLPAVCNASSVPVFTHTDLYSGLGPVGGMLNRGIDQGRIAGLLVARILSGEAAASIPVISPSVPIPTFDHRALARHRLLDKPLPEGSVLTHVPFSIWNEYREPLIGAIIVLITLCFLVAALTLTIVGKRKAESTLRKSREQLRSIYDGMNDAIFIHDPVDASIIDANMAAVKIFGYSLEELRSMRILDLSANTGEETQLQAELMIQRAASGERVLESWRSKRKDGSCFSAEVSLCSAYAGGRDVVIVVSRDITERERANAEREKSLKEKEMLLSEVHHRVKNNFQIISSLLDLQLMEIQQDCANDDPRLSALREPRDRIHAMALVHELLYRSGDFAEIDLSEYLGELAGYISNSYGAFSSGIRCSIESLDVHLDIDRAIPCGLAVNELLINAFKYAFPQETGTTHHPEGKLIQVCAEKIDGGIRLSIQDNGVGLPRAIISGEDDGRLGLTLVRSLASQLRGTLALGRNASDSGTLIVMEFPYTRQEGASQNER